MRKITTSQALALTAAHQGRLEGIRRWFSRSPRQDFAPVTIASLQRLGLITKDGKTTPEGARLAAPINAVVEILLMTATREQP